MKVYGLASAFYQTKKQLDNNEQQCTLSLTPLVFDSDTEKISAIEEVEKVSFKINSNFDVVASRMVAVAAKLIPSLKGKMIGGMMYVPER